MGQGLVLSEVEIRSCCASLTLVSGPGGRDEGAGMCRELSRNAGPQVATLVACAQVGLKLHLCWLMSAGDSPALPCQLLLCSPPQVLSGMPARER